MNQTETVPGQHPAPGTIAAEGRRNTSGPGPEVLAASTLDGTNVVNASGEKIGDIKDIMLDVPHGRIAYAVLSRNGLLGIGEKLFAIPWAALKQDPQRKCFVLNISEESFKDAQGFDKNNWPRMADESWARDIHRHYNQPPYW